ncbi:hypothetical protein T484DRAFT_3399762 [Baffinella frigidus]|nr:hypothetical protein T484DRAFT_3399762 [Cryptophyta sp. CCMP2293]
MNPLGIGPLLLHADATRVVMEFIEGQRLLAFLHSEASPSACRRTLALVLGQLRRLDALSIQKGELVRPDRHVLVRSDGTPVLIDFERCRAAHPRPSNVSQFSQFLGGPKIALALASKGKGLVLEQARLRQRCTAYFANGLQDADFQALLKCVCGDVVSDVTRVASNQDAIPDVIRDVIRDAAEDADANRFETASVGPASGEDGPASGL